MGVKGLCKKKKTFKDMDHSVVVAHGGMGEVEEATGRMNGDRERPDLR